MKENRTNTMKMVVINSSNRSTMSTTMVLKELTTVKILESKLKENNNKMIMDKNYKEKKETMMMIWWELLVIMQFLKKYIWLRDNVLSQNSNGTIQNSMQMINLCILMLWILLNILRTSQLLSGEDLKRFSQVNNHLWWKTHQIQEMLNKVS